MRAFPAEGNSSTSSSRPLPKRTSTSAGLDDFDVWLEQSGRTAPLPPYGASRKRHHSLPTASLYPDAYRPTAGAPQPASSLFTPAGRGRPNIPRLQHDGLATTPRSEAKSRARSAAASAIAASLQPPEMSPREDFLVRAFVSDAMKLHPPNNNQDNHNDDGDQPSTSLPSGEGGGGGASRGDTTLLELGLDSDDDEEEHDDQQLTSTPTPSNHNHHPTKWTREEDERLREAVARFGGKNWKMIAETLGNGRTDVQCLHRWNKVLKPGLVKGPWTPEEDRVLLSLIARYGVGKIRWCDIALHLPGRIGKQCRERWCNHLDSSIRKGQWTPEEDETVFRWQQKLGNKWSEIAKMLPGRTENAVKNRFNSAARRKWLLAQQNKNEQQQGDASTPPATPASVSTVKRPNQQTVHKGSPRVITTTRSSASGGLLAGPPRLPNLPTQRGTLSFAASEARFSSLRPQQMANYDVPSPPPGLGLSLAPFTLSTPTFYPPPVVAASPSDAPLSILTAPQPPLRYSPIPSDSASSSPLSLSTLTTLLWPPKDEGSEQPVAVADDDNDETTNLPELIKSESMDDDDDNNNQREDDDETHAVETPRPTPMRRRAIYYKAPEEPQTEAILTAAFGNHDHRRSPPLDVGMMDDDNMNTFLDSVALELDEIME